MDYKCGKCRKPHNSLWGLSIHVRQAHPKYYPKWRRKHKFNGRAPEFYPPVKL